MMHTLGRRVAVLHVSVQLCGPTVLLSATPAVFFLLAFEPFEFLPRGRGWVARRSGRSCFLVGESG